MLTPEDVRPSTESKTKEYVMTIETSRIGGSFNTDVQPKYM